MSFQDIISEFVWHSTKMETMETKWSYGTTAPPNLRKMKLYSQFSRIIVQKLSHSVPCLRSWLWQLVRGTYLEFLCVSLYFILKHLCCTKLFQKLLCMYRKILPVFRLAFQVMIYVSHFEEQKRDDQINSRYMIFCLLEVQFPDRLLDVYPEFLLCSFS